MPASRSSAATGHLWHFLWLLAQGLTATAVACVTGYSAYWVGQIARRYNRDSPDGLRDRRIALCCIVEARRNYMRLAVISSAG